MESRLGKQEKLSRDAVPRASASPVGSPGVKCALRAVLHWAKMVELLYSLITW